MVCAADLDAAAPAAELLAAEADTVVAHGTPNHPFDELIAIVEVTTAVVILKWLIAPSGAVWASPSATVGELQLLHEQRHA